MFVVVCFVICKLHVSCTDCKLEKGQVKKLKVSEIRAGVVVLLSLFDCHDTELEARGLDPSGLKAAMVERLENAIASENKDSSSSTTTSHSSSSAGSHTHGQLSGSGSGQTGSAPSSTSASSTGVAVAGNAGAYYYDAYEFGFHAHPLEMDMPLDAEPDAP